MAERAGVPQRTMRAVALAAALILAGCQTIVPRGPADPVREAPPPPPPPPPRVETGVEAGIPRDAQRNRVALLVPLSGGYAAVGRSFANATQLAQLDAKSETIRITTYDTAAGAGAAASRAVAEGAQLILGPLLAEDVRAVAPVARAAGVPLLTYSNDASVAGNGTFVLGYTPAQAVARVVAYARGRGVANFGGLLPNTLYGTRASTAFLRAVEQGGGRVVSLQTYSTPASLAPTVQRMAKDAPFDAVLVAGSGTVAAAAVPLVRRASPSARILGTELWASDNSVAAKPPLAGAWFASVSDARYATYAARYRARFGTAPFRLSSLGYDSVLLAVRIGRDWRVGAPFPVARLREGDSFSGIDGAFRFGADGVAERLLEVQEVRGGQTVTVSPAPASFR